MCKKVDSVLENRWYCDSKKCVCLEKHLASSLNLSAWRVALASSGSQASKWIVETEFLAPAGCVESLPDTRQIV